MVCQPELTLWHLFSCLWQSAPNISARFGRPPIILVYYCRSLDRCPQLVTSRQPMMILPFYSLTASIMLGCFAAAFARGPVDGQGIGSEVSKSTRMNLERRENGLSAGADIVVSSQLSVAECTQHLCQVLLSPHHTGYYCRSLDRCPQFVTSIG
ncbi:uncharacterized protein K441DRAFT_81711 [Cenococcum geophilum 1.58]|uniref:uncharacterized protein n=1 Tax=Cenococcum geophilum 1.58 TaxID=794803 RepID=UPI00358EF5F0|nr:hypothetical protein K441DRAFT_81711 [Cenococcum geophilum 1.58]